MPRKRTIETLVTDIYDMLEGRIETKPLEVNDWAEFGWRMAKHVKSDVEPMVAGSGGLSVGVMRASSLGEKCDRKLWYKIHKPGLAEVLRGPTRIKFSYGDMVEEMVLQYARAAGHSVSNEQEVLEDVHKPSGWLIRGHIDAVIDGVVVDVKSASKYSFRKFTEGLKPDTDGFGYLRQLGWYSEMMNMDGGFLAVAKESGRIHLDMPTLNRTHYPDFKALEYSLMPPPRPEHEDSIGTKIEPNGNQALKFGCSYCQFKAECWPGMRAFAYSAPMGGIKPVFYAKVVKEPRVPEIKLEEAMEAQGG